MANFIKVYLLGNSQAVGGGTDLIRNESKKTPLTKEPLAKVIFNGEINAIDLFPPP
jgi:hypothetical protein